MAGKFVIFCDDLQEDQLPPAKQQLQQHVTATDINNAPATTIATTTINTATNPTTNILANLDAPHNKPDDKLKREPLGVRQDMTHHRATTLVAEPQTALPGSSSSAALVGVTNSEDQENDISMASLGSDFVPSILHDDEQFNDDSFYVDDDEEYDERHHGASSGNLDEFVVDEGDLIDSAEEDDYDVEDSEELRRELSQAFKQHDDSQLFKNVVYIDDICQYLHKMERKASLRALPNYMDFQSCINSDKREILVSWLFEVSDEYDLQTETLFICINIVDRFLSTMSIRTSKLQLLGVAALFIASKYEEIYPPALYQFVEITDDACSGKEILQMEQEILTTLDFRISFPTVPYFLRQIFAYNKFPKAVYHLAEYLCYLTLLMDQPYLEYYPSDIALASVILAANQLGAQANISPELKKSFDESNIDQLQRRRLPKGVKKRDLDRRVYILDNTLPFCYESMRDLQESALNRLLAESNPKARSSDLHSRTVIMRRYSEQKYNSVALLSPPKAEELKSY